MIIRPRNGFIIFNNSNFSLQEGGELNYVKPILSGQQNSDVTGRGSQRKHYCSFSINVSEEKISYFCGFKVLDNINHYFFNYIFFSYFTH